MNKNLADRISESMDKKILSKPLLLICITKLWERTIYTKQDNKERREKRDFLVKFVMENQYISKEEIIKILPTISMECCPSYDKIDKVIEIINGGEYSYDESFIPERWIKYKSAEQIEKDMQRKRLADYQAEAKQKNKPEMQAETLSEDELQAREDLYRYVEDRVLCYEEGVVLNQAQMASIDNLVHGGGIKVRRDKEIKYTYALILKTFQSCAKEIDMNVRGRQFKNENHKLNFICTIVAKYINTTYFAMKKAEAAAKVLDRNMPTQYDEEKLKQEQNERFQRAQEAARKKRPNRKKWDFDDIW